MKVYGKIAIGFALLLFTIVFLYPIIFTVYYSLLPLRYIGKIVSPIHFTFENYVLLFTKYPIAHWLFNTAFTAVCCVIGSIVVNCMAGYALSRLEFPGRNIIFIAVLGSMMIPYQFIITPVYIRLSKLGWNNHLISLIIPFLINCLFIFMARQFFLSIPKELEEAARVDGLSHASIFFRIVLPNSGPLITSITIFSFTGTWNSYLAPATFINKRSTFTLAVGLKTVKDFQYERMNLTLAGVVMLSLPILVMFLLLQKHFVEGVATTGIKG